VLPEGFEPLPFSTRSRPFSHKDTSAERGHQDYEEINLLTFRMHKLAKFPF
jgi:hypothetical protein